MPNRGVSRKPSTLTISLDLSLLTQLERHVNQQLLSMDEWILQALQQTMVREVSPPPKKNRTTAGRHQGAPMDAFLPEGVDPFAPAETVTGLASSFEDVQARMRFAGTPALLRDFV